MEGFQRPPGYAQVCSVVVEEHGPSRQGKALPCTFTSSAARHCEKEQRTHLQTSQASHKPFIPKDKRKLEKKLNPT